MSNIPDIGDFPPSKKQVIISCTMSLFFLGIVGKMNQKISFFQDFGLLFGSSFLLFMIYWMLHATFSKRSIKHGYIKTPRVFWGTKDTAYEQIESFGLYKVKQKYGERDSIQFFTHNGQKIIFMKGTITDRDYQRVIRWAKAHFQER